MATKDLNKEQIHELYEQACDLRNALFAVGYRDPTTKSQIDKFDEFLEDNDLIDWEPMD